jgi:pilus assembly protein FimV
MMRKLVVFLTAAMLVCMPLAANALGFGSLKLNSSLNEPLHAEIELLSATSADVSGLSVKLASSEAFLRAGIDRPALLGEMTFAIKQRDNGSYYILVNSKSPVREPFLNFLLEMNWQNGRMLREYTMLLDPPTQVRKQPTVVEAPAATAAAEVAQQEAVEPEATPFVETPAETAVVEAEPAPADIPLAETAAVAAAATVLSEEGEVVEPVAEDAPVLAAEEQVAEPLPEDVPVLSEEGAITETVSEDMPVPAEQEVAVLGEEGQVAEPDAETAVLGAAAVPVLSEEGDVVEAAPADVPVLSDEGVVEETVPAEAAIFADDAELLPRIPLAAYVQEEQEEEVYQPAGELDYGIVRKGDNLWTIAEKLRPDDSISIYQVMMALLQSNPDAFVDGNVNRLKVGHVLRVEDASLLTAMSQKEAALEFQAQTEAWEGYRQQVAETTATQPIIASEVEMGEVAEAETSGELTLASPEGTELQAGAGVTEGEVSNDIVTLQDELRQVRNDAGIMRGRNNELNAKLQELEEELSRLQRSITIKDDELASLQQQLAELQQQPMIEAEAPAPVAAMEEPVQAVAEPEPAPEAPVAEATSDKAAMIAEEPVAETTAEMAAAPSAESMAVEGEPAKPMPVPPVAAVPTKPVPQAEEGLLDSVLNTVMGGVEVAGDTLSGLFGNMVGDSLLIFIALPVLLVLIILVLIMVRRRRKAAQPYQESILTGGPASVTGAEAAEESEEESSFLSDFAVSGAGAIQTQDSEVDPLTEADVFMAYGRYEAAEERLADAINSEPNRPELKLKLLELFHATKNKPSFENTAEAFYASLGDDARSNPMWQKVAALGAELVPGNPLFSGGAADLPDLAASQDPGMSLSDSQVMDIGLDTGVFDAVDTAAPAGGMDFNLDIGGGDTVTPATATEEPGGLDFNLDMGESSAEAAPEPELAQDSGSLDFDLDLGAGYEPDTGPSTSEMEFSLDMAAESGEDDTASFDLGGSFDSGTQPMPEPSLGEDDTTSFDMGSSFESGTQSMPEPTADDLSLGGFESDDLDISGGDEVGTKLDLAKAYIDMGDPDGARSILDEVMAEGNDSQKSEAQSLLDQIA